MRSRGSCQTRSNYFDISSLSTLYCFITELRSWVKYVNKPPVNEGFGSRIDDHETDDPSPGFYLFWTPAAR